MSKGFLNEGGGEEAASMGLEGACCASHGPAQTAPVRDWEALILGALEQPIAVVDGNLRLLYRNRAFEQTIGQGAPIAPGACYRSLFNAFMGYDPKGGVDAAALLARWAAGKEERFEEELGTSGEAPAQQWWRITATRLPAEGTPGARRAISIVHQKTTHLQKARQELRESHALFHHVIENVRAGVFMFDLDGNLVLANDCFAEALGLEAGQVIGRNCFELFKPEMAQTIQEQNLLVLTTGQSLHFELMLETVTGPRNIVINKGVYRNHRNEVAGIFGIACDSSQQQHVRQTLEKSERHFRALIENSADRVTLLSSDGTIRYTSPSSQRILGFDLDDLVNSNFFLWVHQHDLSLMLERFRDVLARPGETVTIEYRALCHSNRWQWMEATMSNLLGDPSVGAIIVNERDISERKRNEEQLRRFAEIIESSNDAIISVDRGGTITSWNPAATRTFGFRSREIIGKSVTTLVPEDRMREYRTLLATVLRDKGVDEVETLWHGKNGERVDVSLTLSAMSDKDRRIVGFSIIARDITERRSLEKQILEISDREKQRLGQDLHDDLCQHLIGISLIGNLLQQDLHRNRLEQAAQAGELTAMVCQTVERARNLARGLCLVKLAGDGFCEGVENLVATTGQMFRIATRLECRGTPEIANESVAVHLYRIAQEALHNAAKHSEATEIVVRIDTPQQGVEVTISDNGVGMPAHPKKERPDGGGLGMHTMRYRARIIGATLEFRPNPEGGGTTVACFISRHKCTEKKEETARETKVDLTLGDAGD
ncbi:MAG TPA: PAS domain S-box protein [Chthoniobacteraceae bacterium]|nr:PAS domain S-box protein [Chthoniobacteraceae bacterium]